MQRIMKKLNLCWRNDGPFIKYNNDRKGLTVRGMKYDGLVKVKIS